MSLPAVLREAFEEAREQLEHEKESPAALEQRAHIERNIVPDPLAGERRLADLLDVARDQVPRYAALRKLDRPPRLADLAVVVKRDLQAAFPDFIARDPLDGAMAPGSFYLLRTSGSTGEPVSTLKTVEGDGMADAIILERLFASVGVPETGVALRVALMPRETQLVEVSLSPRPFINWNLRGYNPTLPDVREEYEAVVGAFGVDLIYGTSSRIISLAFWCQDRSVKLRPSAIIASYDEMPDSGRQLVEETFDAPVTMLYGTTETGLAAWECRQRALHFQDDWLVTEMLAEDGSPADAGAAGQLVLTSLKSSVMPILRYDTGDLVAVPSGGCACGLPGTAAPGLRGRSSVKLLGLDNEIYTVYPLTSRLADIGLLDYQVVQDEPGVATLITPSRGPDPAVAVASINSDLSDYFGRGRGFRLRLGPPDSFVLTGEGKRNVLVQRLEVPLGAERASYLRLW